MNRFSRNILGILVFVAATWPASAQHHPTLPHSKNKIVVISHRGNHVEAPENTLASTKEAITCGADYVEVDLRTTKDGRLVVLHDSKVDRTTNGTGMVASMTLEEVRNLQVFNRNKKSHRVPEFKEVLVLCKGKINIYLDFKEADVAETWREIKAAGMEKQVVVYLNKETQYQQWKDAAPEIPLMTSLPKEVTTREQLADFLKKRHIQILDNVANPEMVKAANGHGVAVWLDVQDPKEGPASWTEALHKGVQGLQTDRPADMVSFFKNHSSQ